MEDYFSYPFYYYQDELSYDEQPNPFENGLAPFSQISINNMDNIYSTDNLISEYPPEPVVPKIPLPDTPDFFGDSGDRPKPLPRYIPYTIDSMTDIYNMDKTNYIDDMYNIDQMSKADPVIFYSKPLPEQPPEYENIFGTETKGSTKSPFVSNNPERIDVSVYKELTSYRNAGSPSGKSDFLYTGTYGTWTFTVPPEILNLRPKRTEIIIKAVLDDHRNIPVSKYSAKIFANGTLVHSGRLPLEHAAPASGNYRNWSRLTFRMPALEGTNKITIRNTSAARKADWMAFIWMELRIYK